ncbi:MAG: pseudoazurin [Alphaproteobacteria bacterium]
MRKPVAFLALVLAAGLGAPSATSAAEYTVRLLNQGRDGAFVFEPLILRIAPGDSVTFLPVDRGHSGQLIKGFAPAGARAWQGKLNKPVTVTFARDGVYGVQCAAHVSLGMAGLIIVGDPGPNLAQARALTLPKRVRQRIGESLAALD